MNETLKSLDELGYFGMLGLIRAKRDGILKEEEYRELRKYCNNMINVDPTWYRMYIF